MQPGPKGFDYLVWKIESKVIDVRNICVVNCKLCRNENMEDLVEIKSCEPSLDNIKYSDTIKNILNAETLCKVTISNSPDHNYRITEV